MHLDHRERFEMDARAALLQPAHHFQIMIECQIGMQPADNVKFRRAFAHALFRALINLFERIHVRAGSVRIAPKRAQLAMRHANVGRIDVPIDVEIGDVAVALLANMIREPADREQIRRAKQQNAVVARQPFARQNLVGDRLKRWSVMVSWAMFRSQTSEIFKRAKGPLQRPRTTGTTY